MATEAQFQKAREDVAGVIKWFAEIDSDTILRKELGEKLSFESDIFVFQRAIDLYKSLVDCDLSNLSFNKLTSLATAGKETSAVINRAIGFQLETAQAPLPDRNAIVQAMRDRWEADFESVTPILAYVTKASADFTRLEREAKGTLATLKETKKTVDRQISDLTNSMNDALDQVRDAAKEAGVSKHSQHFKDEADYFSTSSKIWLAVTVAFAIAALSYVVMHLEPSLSKLESPTWQAIVHHSIPRLIVLFVLTFGLIWSAKNYMAAVHNMVVNRHRKNALASFQAFIEGASSPETKDAVLMQATHAIFTPQDSGFAKGDSPSPASQVVEVFRSGNKAKDE